MRAGDRIPAVVLARGPRRRVAECAAGGRVAEQPAQRVAQRVGVARAGRAARRRARPTSGNPPTALSTSGRPNASAVKRTPDWSISRYGRTTTSARSKNAGSSSSSTNRSMNRTPEGAAAFSGAMSIRGIPTTHSSAPSMPRHASTATSIPL